MVNSSKPQSAGRSPGDKPHPQSLCRTGPPFPLTPALSLGEREIPRRLATNRGTSTRPEHGRWCSLSPRERAGVRGKGLYANPTSQTMVGTVKLLESSARAGGLPSALTGLWLPARGPPANFWSLVPTQLALMKIRPPKTIRDLERIRRRLQRSAEAQTGLPCRIRIYRCRSGWVAESHVLRPHRRRDRPGDPALSDNLQCHAPTPSGRPLCTTSR